MRVLLIAPILLVTAAAVAAPAQTSKNRPVGITPELMSLEVQHQGQPVALQREQRNNATVEPAFALTSRPCPPFCIQPMQLAEGVETYAELEVIDALRRIQQGDDSILLVDSRTPDWVAKGTIPGATSIPWTGLNPKMGASTEGIVEIMTQAFGVALAEDADAFAVDEAIVEGNTSQVFDFSGAKTLVLFCNGMWCGQSPVSIRTLLKFGYPPQRLKWYRGGMQDWAILGLTRVKP